VVSVDAIKNMIIIAIIVTIVSFLKMILVYTTASKSEFLETFSEKIVKLAGVLIALDCVLVMMCGLYIIFE